MYPKITQRNIAKEHALSQSKRNIKSLRENGYIEREGAKKTGKWKVLKNIIENQTEILTPIKKLNDDTLNDTLNDTLKLLKMYPKITQKDIAKKLKISEITVKRNIKTLSERGYIEREGAKKTGMWKVLKDK